MTWEERVAKNRVNTDLGYTPEKKRFTLEEVHALMTSAFKCGVRAHQYRMASIMGFDLNQVMRPQ